MLFAILVACVVGYLEASRSVERSSAASGATLLLRLLGVLSFERVPHTTAGLAVVIAAGSRSVRAWTTRWRSPPSASAS